MSMPTQTPPPELKTSFDLTFVRDNVKLINQRINKLELEGITNSFDFEMDIMESHPEFYQSHPFLVKKLCKREDISMLDKMLNQLEIVESGNKSLSGVEVKLGEELASEYLYPVIDKSKLK